MGPPSCPIPWWDPLHPIPVETIDPGSGDDLADPTFPTFSQLILNLAKGTVLRSVRVRAGFLSGPVGGRRVPVPLPAGCWAPGGWPQHRPRLQVAFQCKIPRELFLRLFPTAAFEAPQTELEVNKEAFVQVPPPAQCLGWGVQLSPDQRP